MTTLPLSDLRVLEAGQLVAGPFCAQLLGDFGAEVIKLEEPGKGDPMREWGRDKTHGDSLWWPIITRNKKSITCNLRTEQGQELVRRLVPECDILVENFRAGTLERWGLGYERLSQINPRLILVRVTGFGQTGPYSPRAGYGSIGEAMGGLRYVTGGPAGPPSRTGISLGDSLAGIFAAFGAMVAIHARLTSNRGQMVDTAIYEAVLGLMESLLPEWHVSGHQRERTGSVLPNVAPSNVYPTRDGEMLLIAANQDTVFGRLAQAMGAPGLTAHPRFATHEARGLNMRALDDLIEQWSITQTAGELLDRLNALGVPAGRIYRAKDMFVDPHFQDRKSIVWLPHETLGSLPMQGVVPKLTGSPGAVRWAGPSLGQHNDEIYGGLLGLSSIERDNLANANVV